MSVLCYLVQSTFMGINALRVYGDFSSCRVSLNALNEIEKSVPIIGVDTDSADGTLVLTYNGNKVVAKVDLRVAAVDKDSCIYDRSDSLKKAIGRALAPVVNKVYVLDMTKRSPLTTFVLTNGAWDSRNDEGAIIVELSDAFTSKDSLVIIIREERGSHSLLAEILAPVVNAFSILVEPVLGGFKWRGKVYENARELAFEAVEAMS